MGDIFGGGGGQKMERAYSETNPWGPQGSYLEKVFNLAEDTYFRQKDVLTPWDRGLERYASPTDEQRFAQQQWGDIGQQLMGLANGMPDYAGQLTDQAARYQALDDQWRQAAWDVQEKWNDPDALREQQLASTAAYADNPYIDDLIGGVATDVNRNAASQVANLNAQASASGNMNNSRAGVAEGVIGARANEDIGQFSTDIRNNAWNLGLAAALQDTQTAMGADMNILQMLQTDPMGAAKILESAGGMGLRQTGLQGDLLNAAGVATQTGADYGYGLDQIRNENAFARYSHDKTMPWQDLMNYYNIIGGRSWGSQGFQDMPVQQEQKPDIWSKAIKPLIGGTLSAWGGPVGASFSAGMMGGM